MALFKLQERKEDNIEAIMRKSKEQKELKPIIKLKGTGLLEQLSAIKQKVQESLGEHVKDYRLITTDKEWIDYCKQAVKDGYVAIDTETDSLDSILAHLVGVCIYSKSQKPAYVPVGHISVVTEQKVEPQVSLSAITKGMEILKEAKCIFHNAYYDLVIIYQNTGVMLEAYDDTLIMAWYMNENEQHGLKYLYDKYCETSGVHTFGELFEGIPCCYVPYNIFMAYGAKDAYMTYKLWEFYKQYMTHGTKECIECGLDRLVTVYETVERPLIGVLVDMKIRGIKFDFDKAKELKIKYTKLKEEAEKEFHKAVEPLKKEILERQKLYGDIEYPVNFNSPAQIKVLFYEIIKTGVIFKKEPTGTGKHVIEEILNNKKYANKPIYYIASALQEVKKYDKLIGSFIDKLSEDAMVHNGRVFTSFNQVGTNCVTADTLLLTDKGYEYIGNLVKNKSGEIEKSDNIVVVNRYGNYEKVSHTYRYNNVDTIKIRTFYGFEIEGTKNHPVMIDNNTFRELGDLSVGDYIYVPYGYNKFPTEYLPLKKDVNCRLYGKSLEMYNNLPDVLNETIAEFLGMYHADGSVTTSNGSYRVNIENHNPNAIKNIKNIMRTIFGVEPDMDTSYNKIKKMNRSGIWLSGVGISWLDNYMRHGARNKKIPDAIYKSPQSVICAYLRGLCLDSSIYYKHNHVELSISIYDKQDAIFVQSFLLNLGILSSVRHSNSKIHNYYGSRLAINDEFLPLFFKKIGTPYDKQLENFKFRRMYQGVRFTSKGTLVKIREISYSKADVYDLHLPETHSFISNGIVSHNTLRMSSSSPNLQQVPSHNDDIRNMFVPDKDCLLVNLDFSQQEMMAVASLADDDKMLESFHLGRDIYSHVASIAFNKPYEECLEFNPDGTTNKEGKDRRKQAKAICLGIVYGKGVPAIAEDLHVTIEVAQRIKDSVLGAFPKLAQYLKDVVEFGKEYGFVYNFFGCKRRLPMLQAPEYEIDFVGDVDDKTRKYYETLYLNKLKNCYSFRDREAIIQQAMTKGVRITDNHKYIAEETRNSYNCVDKETEILTENGWKKYNELNVGDTVLSYNMDKNIIEFDTVKNVNIYDNIEEDVVEFSHPSFSAVSTYNHRWVVYDAHANKIRFRTTEKLSRYGSDRILRCADNNFEEANYSDDFLRLCGWVLTDSHYKKNKQHNISSVVVSQSKPDMVKRIQIILNNLDIDAYESTVDVGGNFISYSWDLHKKNSIVFFDLFPDRKLTYDFIFSLSQRQANILLNELILGDGSEGRRLFASSKEVANLYQCLAFVAGKSASISERNVVGRKSYSTKINNSLGYVETKNVYYIVNILKIDKIQIYHKHCLKTKVDLVWCPTTNNGTWVARRNGKVYITGNSPVQSTAAILTKIAMNNVAKNERLKELGVSLVLTIHDEIGLNVPKEYAYEAIKIAEKEFLGAGKDLKADLRCDIAIAECWAGKELTFDENHNLIPKE